MKYWIMTFIIIVIIVMYSFIVAVPIQNGINQVTEIVDTITTFDEWVDGITSMDTNYEKILKEGR